MQSQAGTRTEQGAAAESCRDYEDLFPHIVKGMPDDLIRDLAENKGEVRRHPCSPALVRRILGGVAGVRPMYRTAPHRTAPLPADTAPCAAPNTPACPHADDTHTRTRTRARVHTRTALPLPSRRRRQGFGEGGRLRQHGHGAEAAGA